VDVSYNKEKEILPTLGDKRLILNYNTKNVNRNLKVRNLTPINKKDKYNFDISYNLKLANPVNNGRVVVRNIL
jgi:hypothetical protein